MMTSKTRRTLRALGVWPPIGGGHGGPFVTHPEECAGVFRDEPCGRNAMQFDEFCPRPDHDVWTVEEIEDARKRGHERFIRMGWDK